MSSGTGTINNWMPQTDSPRQTDRLDCAARTSIVRIDDRGYASVAQPRSPQSDRTV
jgi:hypothetical protein